jgi:hypothetical protein
MHLLDNILNIWGNNMHLLGNILNIWGNHIYLSQYQFKRGVTQ